MIDNVCAGAAGAGRGAGATATGNRMWVATAPVARHSTRSASIIFYNSRNDITISHCFAIYHLNENAANRLRRDA